MPVKMKSKGKQAIQHNLNCVVLLVPPSIYKREWETTLIQKCKHYLASIITLLYKQRFTTLGLNSSFFLEYKGILNANPPPPILTHRYRDSPIKKLFTNY